MHVVACRGEAAARPYTSPLLGDGGGVEGTVAWSKVVFAMARILHIRLA